MALPWVRLETAFPTNPKTLALVEDRAWQAIAAYICGLSYCGQQGTAGFIPKSALPYLHARPADARKLVEVGMWIACPGGWEVNGWLDFQPTSDEIQRRKERAKKAAAARWSKVEAEAARALNDA